MHDAATEWNTLGPAVWRRRGQGARLAVVGAVHGDEAWGARVVLELKEDDHPVWAERPDADVTLAIGNPAALASDSRHAEGGADLNRLFVEEPGLAGESPEHARAAQLVQALRGVVRLLDIHQTSCASPLLAVVPDDPRHVRAALALGVEVVVTGVSDIYGGTTLGEWIDRAGGLGLTIETGRKGTAAALEAARMVATRFIAGAPAAGGRVKVYELSHTLASPGPGLRFVRELGNTSPVAQGEVLARWDGGELRADLDGAAFLPRPHATPGSPCVILAHDRGWRHVDT